jgi:hypothetical protein
MSNTKDEVIKQWPESPAPANSFAGAAQSGGSAFSTFPAVLTDRDVNGDNTDGRDPSALPSGGATEYVPPASNLPAEVSAAESLRHNCRWQAQTPWDVEPGEVGPLLAGTQMTSSATPTDTSTEDAFRSLVRRGGGR